MGGCTWGVRQDKQAQEGALEESHGQAPPPADLLQEEDTTELSGDRQHGRNHAPQVGAHTQTLQCEVQREAAVTDGKPAREPGDRPEGGGRPAGRGGGQTGAGGGRGGSPGPWGPSRGPWPRSPTRAAGVRTCGQSLLLTTCSPSPASPCAGAYCCRSPGPRHLSPCSQAAVAIGHTGPDRGSSPPTLTGRTTRPPQCHLAPGRIRCCCHHSPQAVG